MGKIMFFLHTLLPSKVALHAATDSDMLERNYNKKRAGAEVNSVPALGDGGVPRRLPQQ